MITKPVRVARVRFNAPASQVDDILSQIEGGKRRMSDGRISIDDSPSNLELIRQHFPQAEVERTSLGYPPIKRWSSDPLPQFTYSPRTRSMAHQKACQAIMLDRPCFLISMEQGLGKTKTAIDKMARHFTRQEISGVAIITFKGVHYQWAADEIPKHLGFRLDGNRRIPIRHVASAWDGKYEFNHPKSLNVLEFLCLTFSSVITNKGVDTIEAFMERHAGHFGCIVDESQAIKTAASQRTEACIEIGRRASVRLALSGTPISKSVEDAWSQTMFLDEAIFGHRYVSTFRTTFREFSKDGKEIIGDRNVDLFNSILEKHCYRTTKAEALDIPPKVYERWHFRISKEQRRHYNELKTNFLTQLDSGADVTVQNGAVCVLRLQQICSGFLVDEDKTRYELENTRLIALGELLQKYEMKSKFVIWCRFTDDIKMVEEFVSKIGKAVTYYGATDRDERLTAKDQFNDDPSTMFFISNPAAGGTGLNLQMSGCDTVIYYSNSFNSIHRWQSEDRVHRIGTTAKVNYIDLIADSTVDEGILASIRANKSLADLALGDFRRLIAFNGGVDE